MTNSTSGLYFPKFQDNTGNGVKVIKIGTIDLRPYKSTKETCKLAHLTGEMYLYLFREESKPEWQRTGAHAGAALPDKQMRVALPDYPVDRYLVESSNKIEMIKVIDDDLWKVDPAIKPEDEIILQKLHDMLVSTADDLKVLSGELARHHQPGVQVRSLPTPLDDDFNDKLHIEEVVSAKFHGHKLIDSTVNKPAVKRDTVEFETIRNNVKSGNILSVDEINVNSSKISVCRKLSRSKTRTMQINDELNKPESKTTKSKGTASIAYNELSYEYKPEPAVSQREPLQVQHMPSINIRSELVERKVLHLDIIPETNIKEISTEQSRNVAVLELQHEARTKNAPQLMSVDKTKYHISTEKRPVRKVSRMSTCESSESANNASPDAHVKSKSPRKPKAVIRTSATTAAIKQTNAKYKKQTDTRKNYLNLEEWKRKLNTVYGQPSSTRQSKFSSSKNNLKKMPLKKSNLLVNPRFQSSANAEYIPYSELTLGGVRVSDIEKEVSDGPIINDLPLTAALDKILSSRENSFHADSPIKGSKNNHKHSKILSTSDENLLQEVIDIENKVSKTLRKNPQVTQKSDPKTSTESSANAPKENDSYEDDDFEEVANSVNSPDSDNKPDSNTNHSENKRDDIDNSSDCSLESGEDNSNNKTYIKTPNLTFKNSVDIFEFVHSVDTQDNATQSNTSFTILKETQTTPRNENLNNKPINKDFSPSIDPRGEVESLFKVEKEFIKRLILEEYGDIIEKSIDKPSTSKVGDGSKNVIATQKITQTSPAHVKSVMTSPTRTKTRTTSPFTLNLTVDHQTSPLIFFTKNDSKYVEVTEEHSEEEEFGISINLSSPRFSLRLPQTSREVLSNLDICSKRPFVEKHENIPKDTLNKPISSSNSVDADASSSELSSLGEVNLKLKRKMRSNRIQTISESSASSSASKSSSDFHTSGILPLRSEGEVSLRQPNQRHLGSQVKSNDNSLGQL